MSGSRAKTQIYIFIKLHSPTHPHCPPPHTHCHVPTRTVVPPAWKTGGSLASEDAKGPLFFKSQRAPGVGSGAGECLSSGMLPPQVEQSHAGSLGICLRRPVEVCGPPSGLGQVCRQHPHLPSISAPGGLSLSAVHSRLSHTLHPALSRRGAQKLSNHT